MQCYSLYPISRKSVEDSAARLYSQDFGWSDYWDWTSLLNNTGPMNALTIKTRDAQVRPTSRKNMQQDNTFQKTKIIFLTYPLWGPLHAFFQNTKNWSWRSADHSAESLRSFRPRCTSCRCLELAPNLWRYPATMDSNEQHSILEQTW